MYFLNFLAVSLVALSALAREEDVLEFDDSDFDIRIAEHDTALVMFYAPWCGHCKRIKPEYAKAAEDLIRNDPPVTLIKVNCIEDGRETCDKNSVNGYPTLKIFHNGKYSQDYYGLHEAKDIVKYMKAQVGPLSKELKSATDLDQFLASEKEPVVVGFFEKESDLKAAFFKVADKLWETVKFAHSSFKDVLDKQGESDGVVLFRPAHLKNIFEPVSVTYLGAADSDHLNDFIDKNVHGLAGIRKSDNQRDFKSPLVVAYLNIDYVKNLKGTNYWRNRVLKVAKEYKGKVNFAISPSDEFLHELMEFGIEFAQAEIPKVAARDAKERKFVMNDGFSVEALQTFVDDLLSEKLKPYIKSEPIPENQDGPVVVAVAKNFEEVVTDNNKDTLIEFYAPWCDHCKKLAPAYDELGEKLEGEDIAIVKMDATANDVYHPYGVKGFPTLFWASKNKKDRPVRYDGGREVDDFIKYIAKEATNELNGWDRSGIPKAVKTEL